VDDSDEEESDCDNENNDGMVLDEGEDEFPCQEENMYSKFDDGASLFQLILHVVTLYYNNLKYVKVL